MEVVITAIGDYLMPDAGAAGGHPVELESADPAVTLTEGVPVTIFGEGSSTETLAVPLTAIRQDSDGSYVLVSVANSDKEAAEKRVAVTVLRSGGGYASIEADLTPGELVLVSR